MSSRMSWLCEKKCKGGAGSERKRERRCMRGCLDPLGFVLRNARRGRDRWRRGCGGDGFLRASACARETVACRDLHGSCGGKSGGFVFPFLHARGPRRRWHNAAHWAEVRLSMRAREV